MTNGNLLPPYERNKIPSPPPRQDLIPPAERVGAVQPEVTKLPSLRNLQPPAERFSPLQSADKFEELFISYYNAGEEARKDLQNLITTYQQEQGRLGDSTFEKVGKIIAGIVSPSNVAEIQVEAETAEQISVLLQDAEDKVEKADFFARVYGQSPLLISTGRVSDAGDILDLLKVPESFSEADMDTLENAIAEMLDIYGIKDLPELAGEMAVPDLPELQAPTEVSSIPININQLTIEEIKKALTLPIAPEPVMTEEEWVQFLIESGQISDKADLETVEYYEQKADELILEWQERNNMLETYRTEIALMPAYGVIEFMKEMAVMPGLGLLELAGVYFEHVTMPLAGLAWKDYVPDLEAAYQRYAKEESTWKALSHAWEEWDAPGDGTWEWILKYMIMEGAVDPLTYVGWGIATRLTRPFGVFGRIVGATERGLASTMELPFDMIKATLRRLPKTIGQRAAIALNRSNQYSRVFMEDRYGDALYRLNMKQWIQGVEEAIAYTLSHPMTDNPATRFGMELLRHSPITRDEIWDWAQRLGTTLLDGDVTKQTVESVNRLFEDLFFKYTGKNKLQVTKEGADALLHIFNAEVTDKASAIAAKILNAHGKRILSNARSFGRLSTPLKAARELARRNYRTYITTEESILALARREMGSMSGLLTDIPITIQKAWTTSIDKWIIRPFAESYLTFALYGPMNIIEDAVRTVLGGVGIGRKSPQSFARRWAGINYDNDLMRDAVSETIGYLRQTREGELNNWILQIGGLAKGFGDKTFNLLVRRPGHIGIDMRRNFVDRKALQILKELGGDAYHNLVNAGPKDLPGVNKNIAKEVQQTITELKTSGNPDSIRASMDEFTYKNVHNKEVERILMEHPDVPTSIRDFYKRTQKDGDLFRDGATSIDKSALVADNLLLDDFISSPERASIQFEQLADMLTELEVTNPQEMARLMQSLNLMSSISGATPKQILGRAVERSRGLPLAQRNLHMAKVYDDIADFQRRSNASIRQLREKIRQDNMSGLFDDNPNYILKSETLFDLQTEKSLRAEELTNEINAWRHEWFARGKPKDQHIADWWDDFYRESTQRHHDYNVEMAQYDGRIKNAIDDVNISSGTRLPTRPAILITDRPLAPNDVASLLGARGDDVSRGLLDVMTAQNDRDMFVEYVMAQVKANDIGFNRESVGRVFDQIMESLNVRPETASWISGKRLEMDAIRKDLHTLYNSKLLPDNELEAIQNYIEQTAKAVEDLTRSKVIGDKDVGLGEFLIKKEDLDQYKANLELLMDEGMSKVDAQASLRMAFEDEIGLDFAAQSRMREKLTDWANEVKVTPDNIAIAGGNIAKFNSIRDEVLSDPDMLQELHKLGWSEYDIRSATSGTEIGELLLGDLITVSEGIGTTALEVERLLIRYRTIDYYTLGDVIDNWFHNPNNEALQLLGDVATDDVVYRERIQSLLAEQYPEGLIRIFRGSGSAGPKALERKFTNVTSSRNTALEFQNTWDSFKTEAEILALVPTKEEQKLIAGFVEIFVNRELDTGGEVTPSMRQLFENDAKMRVMAGRRPSPDIDNILIKNEDVIAIGAVGESELIIPSSILKARIEHPIGDTITATRYQDYNQLRQQAMDEAHKWYYKEFTDYSNANVFDAIIKSIYPFWTYESQRWFWLPRSFVRHPGTFTAFERWQDNTDYGYIHVPGTDIDINPFRGTIYGTLSTRLTKRDFPEYYDSLGAAQGLVEFSDFLSRYGFYPGAHIGLVMSMFMGSESQLGEVLPAMVNTPLNLLVGMFPDNESVKWISDHVFSNRFRDYLTNVIVNRMGGDGSLIFAKMAEGKELTPEEQQIWTDARQETAYYSSMFEQFSLFRFRTDEQYEMYEKAGQVIQDLYGYTPKQQDWLRKHGYRIWDMVGSPSPREQEILEEVDYYRWSGQVRPLLPSQQQKILNEIEIAWDQVETYSEQVQRSKLQLQRDFLSGARGPRDYNSELLSLYNNQRQFIDNKIEEVPLMDLHNRAEYNKKYDIAIPVMHPMKELLNLYFDIELKETTDPETGEIIMDWDNFWAQRMAIEQSIPEEFRAEWDEFISKNSTRIEEVRRTVYSEYFRTYNLVWNEIASTYNKQEQSLINEYLYLERTGQKLDRQEEIKNTVSEKTGDQLISSFRSEVSDARRALRFKNPYLDAWLFFWGRTTSFVNELVARPLYEQIARQTGRVVD